MADQQSRDYVPEPDSPQAAGAEQAPLGEHASYDDLLDVAVQYTFPCSDPISVDSCCAKKGQGSSFEQDTRPPGEGSAPLSTDTVSRPH